MRPWCWWRGGENLLNQLEVELKSHDYAALAVPGDVTDPECPAKVFSAALEAFGRVDILVNNAGISDHHWAASRTPDELWERVVAVNQTAPFRFAREALRHMTAQGSGNIINISSIGGVYSIAGAGVFGFEDRAYRPDQEHCRAVCRYWDSLQRRLPRADPIPICLPSRGLSTTEMLAITGRRMDTTTGMSEAIDMANACLFFACDESRYINGQCLVIDKGSCL